MRIQQIVSPSNDYSNISKLTYFSRNVPSFSSIDGGDNPFLNSVTRIILNIRWLIEKAREFQKNTYLCVINYAKAFDCVDHNKLWKALKLVGIPNHLKCLLTNLYAGQEATVRTLYGTTDWFETEKGVRQGCLLSPCFFIHRVQFSSVAKSYQTLCVPMDCSTSGLPVHHQLVALTQTHVH